MTFVGNGLKYAYLKFEVILKKILEVDAKNVKNMGFEKTEYSERITTYTEKHQKKQRFRGQKIYSLVFIGSKSADNSEFYVHFQGGENWAQPEAKIGSSP